MDPSAGPLLGGTVVQVHGVGFRQADGLVCRFATPADGGSVAARWLTDSLLECRARARDVAGNVTVEVSINSQDFSTSGVVFEYVDNPVVGGVRPAQGPIGGGTLVGVHGGPFRERSASLGTLYCRFGLHSLSRAQRVSSEVIECASPAHIAGGALVEVSLNGLDFTRSGVSFVYLSPSIEAVHPALGPELGGTLVQIHGANMVGGSRAFCRFGAYATSPAAWVSATRMECITPPMTDGPTTLNLLSMVSGNAALVSQAFEYHASAAVFSAIPRV